MYHAAAVFLFNAEFYRLCVQ